MKAVELKDFEKKKYSELFGIIVRRGLYLVAKLIGSRKYFIYFWYMIVTHGLMTAFAFDAIPEKHIMAMLITYGIQTIVTLSVIGILSFNPVDVELSIKK